MQDLLAMTVLMVLAALALTLYLTPSIVAVARRRPNPMPVIVLNLLLGWTLVGWAVSLAMAFSNAHRVIVVEPGPADADR